MSVYYVALVAMLAARAQDAQVRARERSATYLSRAEKQLRRRRSLISAQGWSASDNPGYVSEILQTLKGFIPAQA